MKYKTVILFGGIAVGLGGLALSLSVLSGQPDWSIQTWQQGQPVEQFPNPPSLLPPENYYSLQGQTVTIQRQMVAGVPIEGSYLKIVAPSGSPTWAKAHYIPKDQLPKAFKVKRELEKLESVRAKTQPLASQMGCAFEQNITPILRWIRGAYHLVFLRNCEAKKGEVFDLAFNSRGALLSREQAGSHFNWETARIQLFPKGPKLSGLELLNVSVSAQPFYLLTPAVQVVSDAGLKIQNMDELQTIRPTDPSFDMVQAYYFSTSALRWAEEKLQIKIEQLKVRTHVGHPEKSNVAFYFGREIRLGEGDEITFSKIPWDPSIVVHEVMHGVIEALTGLPFKGEQGSMQEAFADSLTALQLNSPYMGSAAYRGGAYQRSLLNDMKLSDRNGKMYHDSLIVSGTIWEIKEATGDETALDLMGFLLTRSTPDTGFDDIKSQMQSWLQTCAQGERCDRLGSILSHRGWL